MTKKEKDTEKRTEKQRELDALVAQIRRLTGEIRETEIDWDALTTEQAGELRELLITLRVTAANCMDDMRRLLAHQ